MSDPCGQHLSLRPGCDVEERIASANDQLIAAGFGTLPNADIARIRDHVTTAWTPENVQAWHNSFIGQQVALREQQAATLKATAECKAKLDMALAESQQVAQDAKRAADDVERETKRLNAMLAAREDAENNAAERAGVQP